jgi:hypothetical protein
MATYIRNVRESKEGSKQEQQIRGPASQQLHGMHLCQAEQQRQNKQAARLRAASGSFVPKLARTGFPPGISHHQCSIFIFILTLLVQEGQAG